LDLIGSGRGLKKYTVKTFIFFSSSHIITVMKSKRMGRTGRVEYTGEMIDSCIIFIERAE
jgi:hypothetical protein